MLKNRTFLFIISLISFAILPALGTPQSPYFQTTSGESSLDALPLKANKAQVSISGSIAQVEIRQTYANTGGTPIEAIYIFPGSTRSALHGMEMKIGEKVIVAKIKEHQQARKEYTKAKAEKKSASLLEQYRPNLFQMHVANILPGEEVEVLLRYSEHVPATEGVYEFVMPTAVGPRYSNTDDKNTSGLMDNPYLKQGENSATTFEFTMDLRTGLPLKQVICTSHNSPIKYLGKNHANLIIQSHKDPTAMNRDVIIRYRLAGDQVASGMLLHQANVTKGETENFFLIDIEPPARITPESIPARDYLFVLDVSGSMNGFPLNTARELFEDLTRQLRPIDSFNLLLFASNSKVLSDQSLTANKENISQAIHFMRSQSKKSSGGTELVRALRRALEMPSSEEKSRSIVVITDGFIDFEADAFDLIRKNRGTANVFCFGIGSSVNRHLIEGIANAGSGEAFIVTRPSEASRTASLFREYIQSPILTNVRIKSQGFDAYDLQPRSLPDVFANRPITINGKWKGIPQGKIILTGIIGNGEKYHQIIDISKTTSNGTYNPALKSLWARERIRELSDYSKLKNTQKTHKETIQEITNLGLTYSILTNYTSFIAVDKTPKLIAKSATSVTQASPLPQGVSHQALLTKPTPPQHLVKAGSVPEPGSTALLLVSLVTLLLLRERRCPA